MNITQTTNTPVAHNSASNRLMAVAQSLETTFLSEMLKSAGVGNTPDTFGGGTGEDQFSSFLREEQARQMTNAGGIGLAEHLYNAMLKAEND